MTAMQTDSGAVIDFAAVLRGEPAEIKIADVIHGLAHTNRYAGHTFHPYSVAEHSVLCHALACELWPEDFLIQGACLFHDAHEAYTGDPINPLKVALPALRAEYKRLQDALDVLIARRLRWPEDVFEDPRVKYVDSSVYAYESPRVRRIESPFVVAERIRLFESGCQHWPDEGVIQFLPARRAKLEMTRVVAQAVRRIQRGI